MTGYRMTEKEIERMTEAELSLRLESAFRRFMGTSCVSRDLICQNPTEAIQIGLNWLYAEGIIVKDDVAMMSEEYRYDSASLAEVMSDSFGRKVLCELVDRINFMK